MSNGRWRLGLAVLTGLVTMFSIVLVAWGPPAFGAHIPATGPLPSSCVEFQVNTAGTKSPAGLPGIDITPISWDNGSESHQVAFSIIGLAPGEYVDISVKSGTNVQEAGSYGNGTHSFSNDLQNAISHIRVCVFGEATTSTTVETTTTMGGPTTTIAESTTTIGESTTTTVETATTMGESTTTTIGESTTTIGESTTTVLDPTTTEATTTTVDDEVLGSVVTTTNPDPSSSEAAPSTEDDEVLGTTIVAGDLPFTGLAAETIGQLALALVATGVLTLTAVRVIRGRGRDQA